MAEKGFLPKEKEFFTAKRIIDNQIVYGMGVLYVDESKAYLIDHFEQNISVDGAPCYCYYQAVIPETVIKIR